MGQSGFGSLVVVLVALLAASCSPPSAACVPACRSGYVCDRGMCIAACNPPCPAGMTCVGSGTSANCVTMTDGGADAAGDVVGDAARDGNTGPCTVDSDCNDFVFCNGAERCMPGASGADARGCVAANPSTPCMAGQTCSESAQTCSMPCGSSPDADGDGHRSVACGGDDCDDADAMRFPGNTEVCDTANHDEDCDACTVGSAATGDMDRDGVFATRCCNPYTTSAPRCAAGVASSAMHTCGTDCDDNNVDVHPDATEACNGRDDNCNGMVDEGVMRTFYVDGDGDMFGNPMSTTMTGCNPPSGYAENNTDCDDTDARRNPGAPEVCDSIDNNCNTTVDEGLPNLTCYRDADGDGFAGSGATMMACACPMGWLSSSPTDCDDSSARRHPGAAEVCNGVDEDCDGRIDDGLPTITCFPDGDGDGYGAASGGTSTCATTCPGGTVRSSSDCCDRDASAHPGQTMYFTRTTSCGGFDFDCNGTDDRQMSCGTACSGVSSCSSTCAWVGTPTCGASAMYVNCQGGPSICLPCCTMGSNMTTTVRCR